MSDDEDVPQLSASTLAALQEFYAEPALKEEKNVIIDNSQVEDNIFDANWQLSQFWYDNNTSLKLAKEALRIAGSEGIICLISCPTLFSKLKFLSPDCRVTLLEYDRRFSVYDGFNFYDYKDPLNIPEALKSSFDIVIADPPFLSEECLTRVSQTIKYLAKDKIILCTGAVMEDLAKKLLNLEVSSFKPQHNCNLANEFRCYSNYKIDKYIQ